MDLILCAAVNPDRPPPWPNGRQKPHVKCNRTNGHDGPHRLYDARTFAVRAEWQEITMSGSTGPTNQKER